jgi:hypothetical protein
MSKNENIELYKTVNLRLDVYAYETWSLTLREEHRLKVFEKRVLRRIVSPNKVPPKKRVRSVCWT